MKTRFCTSNQAPKRQDSIYTSCKMVLAITLTAIALTSLVACGGSDIGKANNFIDKGHAQLQASNREAAKIEFTNALRLNKNSPVALFELARIAEQEKNWPQLENHLKSLLKIDPNHLDGRLLLTNFYMGSGNLDLAKSHSDYLVKINPDNRAVKITQSAVLMKQGEQAQALTILTGLLEDNPHDLDALFLLANEAIMTGRYEEALVILDRGLAIAPDNIAFNTSKIRMLSELGQWQKMVPVYQHLMLLFPQNSAPVISLAKGYAAQGETQKAIQLIEAFSQKNSQPGFLVHAVELTSAFEGLAEAEQRLKQYLHESPHPELKFALADMYAQTQRLSEARTIIESVATDQVDAEAKHGALSRLARFAIIENDLPHAEKYISKMLSMNNSDPVAQALKANIMIKQGRGEDAIKLLRGAMRTAPDAAELYTTLGLAHEHEKQWELAEQNFAKALELSQGNILQTVRYAEFLVARNKFDKAQKVLAPVIGSGVDSALALTLYAQVLLTNKEWRNALVVTDTLAKLKGPTKEVLHLRSIAYLGLNQTEKAIANLQQLNNITPGNPKAMGMLVEAYLSQGKNQQAQDFIKETLKRDSNSYAAHMLMGDLASHEHNWISAAQSYRQAIAINSKIFDGHNELIKILYRDNKLDEAQKALDAALQVLPKNIPLLLLQARIWQKLGDPQKAIDTYQDILKDNDTVDVAANNLAILYQQLGGPQNLQKAAEVANRFRQSKVPQYLDTLGWIYVQQENSQEAVALLRRAADKLPNIPEVQYHLAVAFYQTNELAQAKKLLEKNIKLAGKNSSWSDDAEKLLNKINQPQPAD